MNGMAKNRILWVIIALVLMSVFNSFGPRRSAAQQMDYSEFVNDVRKGLVQKVSSRAGHRGPDAHRRDVLHLLPRDGQPLAHRRAARRGGRHRRPAARAAGLLMQIFISWFPMLLLVGVWIFFMRQMQGGGGGRRGSLVRQERARLIGEDQVKVTFSDVAGVEEAKEEVRELVDFLRDPAKFQKLGGKIPRGC